MGYINSSFLLVLSKFFSGDYTWTFCGFVLLCTVEHSVDLIWFWKALMVEYSPAISESISYVKLCGATFRFFGREKSLIFFPFLGISVLAVVALKALPHTMRRHIWGWCIWTWALSHPPAMMKIKSLISHVVSKVDVCVCKCTCVYRELCWPLREVASCCTPILVPLAYICQKRLLILARSVSHSHTGWETGR